MLEVYQAESEEQLALVAQNLRRLEEEPANRDLVQEVRRGIHTLKGAAGMVGLRTAGGLAHRAEDYLDTVFEGRRSLTPGTLRLLFETADALDDLAKAGIPDATLQERARGLEARFGEALRSPAAEAVETLEVLPEELALEAEAPELDALPELDAVEANPEPAPQAEEEIAPAEAEREEEELQLVEPAAVSPPPARKPPARVFESMPPARPAAAASSEATSSGQFVRVPVERVDELVRLVSELVVHRSTLEQQYSRYSRELGEHDLTTGRLRRLAVRLEDDFAARALLAVQSGPSHGRPSAPVNPVQGAAGEFDELEFDRYSEFHLLSRDVTETASDLVSAGVQLRSVGEDFRQALHRFGRVTGQVQDLLMRMRMMQVGSIENRLHRTVRVAATRRGKNVRFLIQGSEVEVDKTLLAEITGPLEHILRNAVDHGLEAPADRVRAGKAEQGTVTLQAAVDGHRALLRISDDGRGLDPERIRTRAVEMGRFSSAQVDEMDDEELFELIFQPGFTTASEVSEISGRGVGLDAVRAAVTKLGGSISIESELGVGASFVIGLPTSLAVTRVLLIESAGRRFCIPAHAVDKVARGRINPAAEGERRATVEVDGRRLPAYRLSDALHLGAAPDHAGEQPILVVEAGERRYGLVVDQVMEARDAVVKSLGPLLQGTPGISSATVLGDGSVALILNPAELPDAEARISAEGGYRAPQEAGLHVLMADDSISVRRVLMKTLEAAGWRYTAARDGQDALEKLRGLERPPDVALLDVEMPRMDGFQLTTALRAMAEYKNLPIVMLTSRAGEKHRRKAAELGANDYLVKPYIEDVLLSALRRAARAGRKAA
jgi:chemosensory pili system protein ChpA (sensor histidine kinase/response regulator)